MEKEISFDTLTIPEAVEIDLKFRQCALLALEEFKVRKRGGLTHGHFFLEDKIWLKECYRKAPFSNRAVHYENEVWDRFEQCINLLQPKDEANRFRVMLPVFFYTLIINNEFNSPTKFKRAQRRTQYDQGEGRINTMKIEGWGNPNPYEIVRSIAVDRTRVSKYPEEFMRTLSKAKGCSGSDLEDDDHVLKASILMNNFNRDKFYNRLLYRKESAEIGEFLRNILSLDEIKQPGVTPLDTILRMYIVNTLDGILYRTGRLGVLESEYKRTQARNMLITKAVDYIQPTAQRSKMVEAAINLLETQKGILERMADYSDLYPDVREVTMTEESTEYVSSVIDNFLSCTIHHQLSNIPDNCEDSTQSFETLYKELTDSFNFSWDFVNTLADIYLDRDVLEINGKAPNNGRKYINAVKKHLEKEKNNLGNADVPMWQIEEVVHENLHEEILVFLSRAKQSFIQKYKGRKIRLSDMKGSYAGKYTFSGDLYRFTWIPQSCVYHINGIDCFYCKKSKAFASQRYCCPYKEFHSKDNNAQAQ